MMSDSLFREEIASHPCKILLAILLTTSTAFPASSSVYPVGLAGCSWRTSEGAQLLVQGDELEIRVKSLPRPMPRTVQCWVSLPASREMIVRGSNVGAVTESGWTFAFMRASGRTRELNWSSQERAFAFPVPPAWMDDERIGIVIGVPGDNPGYVRLKHLRLEPAPIGLTSAPQPLSPGENQRTTPPAADFLWSAPQSGFVSGYDLAWQRQRGSAHEREIPAYFLSDARGFWPDHWLRPGEYSWKVRALNPAGKPGTWSRAFRFRVMPREPYRQSDIVPSTMRPIFLIDVESADPNPVWKRIPADVRPLLVIRVGGSLQHIQLTLTMAQREHIPVALQVNGPHNVINGRWDRVPLSRLTLWARRFTELKAFYICEQEVQGGIENPEVKTYIERLIALGGETGRPVLWADANWGGNIWLDVAGSKDFQRFLAGHPGDLYPIWKMNGGFEPYLAPAGLLGLWLSHTVSAWGVQPESFYWTEAGFRTLGVQEGYKDGDRADAPAVIFQELALLGASAGAEVYSFEPGTDLYGPQADRRTETILVPLIRMLTQPVIPNRQQVQTAVKEQLQLQPADLVFRRHYTSAMRQLFSHTLGIAYRYEMVPESGACYWIPFMPPALAPAGTRPHASDSQHVGLASQSETQTREWRGAPLVTREERCAPPDPHRAAIFRVGGSIFVFDSRVNWAKRETFSLALAGVPIQGQLGLNGWVVIAPAPHGQTHLWFSGRPGAQLVLRFADLMQWQRPSSSEAPSPWSQPTNQLRLAARMQPWSFLLRRSTRAR